MHDMVDPNATLRSSLAIATDFRENTVTLADSSTVIRSTAAPQFPRTVEMVRPSRRVGLRTAATTRQEQAARGGRTKPSQGTPGAASGEPARPGVGSAGSSRWIEIGVGGPRNGGSSSEGESCAMRTDRNATNVSRSRGSSHTITAIDSNTGRSLKAVPSLEYISLVSAISAS